MHVHVHVGDDVGEILPTSRHFATFESTFDKCEKYTPWQSAAI